MKNLLKGALPGALIGVVLFYIGLSQEGHGIPRDPIDLRKLAFGPCKLVTQCAGEECIMCVVFGPILNAVLCGIIGFAIAWFATKLKKTKN